MSYPLSSDVAAGDITASAHYNNLRADALRLGQLIADSVNLGSLLEAYETKLNIVSLATNRVRVEASAVAPVDLVIAGVPVRAVANVDLAAGDVPTGAAATWYVFANRVAGSTTFTLSIHTVLSEAANQRRIGQFYWDGTALVRDSIQTEFSLLLKNLLYFKEPMFTCGRLTLATADPTPTADIASSSTLFFTPYKGNRVSLYVPNYGWRVYEFAEISLSIAAFTTGKNYDIFLYNNAGTLAIEGLVWSNDTLRATALYNQDGRWVKNNAKDRLYLGTIRMSGAGTCADTLKARLVWNNYNRVNRPIKIIDTGSWTYATINTYRPMNNNTANRVEYVVGLVEETMYLYYMLRGKNSADALEFETGIGLDSTSVDSATISTNVKESLGHDLHCTVPCIFDGYPTLGYHYLQLLEYVVTATVTFYAYNYAPFYQTGAVGWIIS